ncbi:MinD/ParA family protein [Alkalibacillus aidingensis]|uniref:MinD/ParA family protein n=1 Tax=Alkalibacillus aidingensis TaxID=2747607 RepID=UPI001661749A|nr:MinD/ParA family protein [Alkalibacillus aidingensis]
MVRDQAYELRQRMLKATAKTNNQQAYTIAIFSGKGGVGKSNVALNFGLGLCREGKKVLILDLDIGMGNIDILLGLQPKQSLSTMLEKKLQISDIIELGPNNLSYIAAGTGLTDFFHMDQRRYEYFLEQFNAISTTFDYIIFDLGAGMSEDHLAFIQSADECFVVTTAEPTSITDAYAAVKQMVVHRQQEIDVSLLINRVQNEREAKLVYHKLNSVISKFLDYRISLIGYLPDDPIVMQAVKQQTPFLTLNPRSKVSKSMNQIVTSFLKEEVASTQNKPFVTRLKSFFNRKVD